MSNAFVNRFLSPGPAPSMDATVFGLLPKEAADYSKDFNLKNIVIAGDTQQNKLFLASSSHRARDILDTVEKVVDYVVDQCDLELPGTA